MIDVCKEYIRSTGKERDAASILIARLLSRYLLILAQILYTLILINCPDGMCVMTILCLLLNGQSHDFLLMQTCLRYCKSFLARMTLH